LVLRKLECNEPLIESLHFFVLILSLKNAS
jgi:hypothetical protein